MDHEGKIGDLLKWGMEDIALKLVTIKVNKIEQNNADIVLQSEEKKGINKMYMWGGTLLLGSGIVYFLLNQEEEPIAETGSVNVSIEIP